MVAIIGVRTATVRPLVDLYWEAGQRAGHSSDRLKVGVHVLGYVAATKKRPPMDFSPGLRPRLHRRGEGAADGLRSRARATYAQRGPQGALMIGNPDEVAEKILRQARPLAASPGSAFK